MRNYRSIILSLGMMGLLLVGAAGDAAAKTGLVNMLNLTGARQVAMGETAVFYDPDPFNLEYNPAAIVGMERGLAGFSYNSFIQDRTVSSLAIIFPAKGLDFGVHLRLSSIDDIEARDETPSSEPLYTFSSDEFGLHTYAAYRFTERFRAGLSVGYLMEKIDTYRASTAVLGLGAAYRFEYGLTGHASISNLGGAYSFREENLNTPVIYRFGLGYHRNELALSADYVNVKAGDSHIHLGGEYLIEDVLFLRAGYQTGYDSRDFSAGAGFVYKNIRIDYAFVPYQADLGTSHRFTATVALR